MPWLKSGINKLIPSPIWQPYPPVKETLKDIRSDAVIIDVGAGGRKITPNTIGIDFIKIDNTGIIGDIHSLSIKEKSIDVIFCTGTLEHIHSPEIALREFCRILKPGGVIHIEVPFMQPYHADPVDYYRWTESGLEMFCNKHGFIKIRSGVNLGPVSAMNAIIIQFFQSFFENSIIRKIIDILLSIILFPFKYLDYILIKKKYSFYFASAVYFVGVKK